MKLNIDVYKEILLSFQDNSYTFCGFFNYKKNNSLILRHDVDFDINAAVAIGRVEQKLGVSSTFFFMLTSPFYNVLSSAGIEALLELRSNGHEISIHFDPTAYPDMDSGLEQELRVFATFFSYRPAIVSLHRPGPFSENNNRVILDIRHTYEDEFFRDMCYYSDSGGSFSYGQPHTSNAFTRGNTMQILTHPI
jgi:hypothetical protein